MRTFKLKLMAVFLCLSCAVFTVHAAKDLYVSATGNDSNDGLTPGTPVKTMGKIHELVGIEDVIHIDGIIDISQEIKGGTNEIGTNQQQNGGNGGFFFKADKWNKVKMVGKDPEKDGFSGAKNSRIFRIDGGTHYFENLLFTEGADVVSDGANAIWLRSSITSFKNCRFVNNKAKLNPTDETKFQNTSGRGGVFQITNGTTDFLNCYFADNANSSGAALYIIGGTVNATGCIFEDHDLSTIESSQGGVIYTWASADPIITIDRCVFQNNSAKEGGAICMNNRTDNNNKKTILKIYNSSFVRNEALNHGGAFYYNNTRATTIDTITIANTTFFGNKAEKFGGAIYLGVSQPKSIFTMVNSSVISNYTMGNGGFSGGLVSYPDVNTSYLLKRIYNCVFDKNKSITQNIFSDMRFRAEPGVNTNGEQELIIKNTFMGFSIDGLSSPGFLTNEVYPGNNMNYCRPQLDEETPEDVYENASGIDDDPEFYLQMDDYYYAIGLKDDAPARTFGDVAYLSEFGILESDQFGKKRTIVGNTCVVGATEATIQEMEDFEFADYPQINSSVGINDNIENGPEYKIVLINGVVSMLNVTENVSLTLYNISGSVVKSGLNQLSVSDLPKGIYIVKASFDNKTFSAKVIK